MEQDNVFLYEQQNCRRNEQSLCLCYKQLIEFLMNTKMFVEDIRRLEKKGV